ncbi:MAG TPA: Wzz/FepE/Etk N-terminal domain-containing protein, partial [Gemmatimonadaceae bacterium]|nr:Wzz/FepE/Etk N-terminal domain-containing protein [Gemmatimonadaceae bacterium]
MSDIIENNRGENIWTSNGSGAPGPLPPTDGADPAVGEVDFRELFAGLRRHLWLILAGTAIAVAIMAVSLIGERPLYASSAVVRLVDNRRAIAGGIADAAVDEISRAGADPTQSLLQILQSKAVAAQVVDNHPIGLRLEPEGFPATLLDQVQIAGPDASDTIAVFFRSTDYGIKESGRSLTAPYGQVLALPKLQFAITAKPPVNSGELVLRSRDNAIGLLGVRLRSRLRKGTDILDLSFTGYEPKSAQLVLNAVLSEFQDYNMRRAQDQSKRRRVFVEAQLKQTDSLLAVLQDELSRFRSTHQLYNSDERISAEQRALLDLDARRDSLDAARQMYTSMLSTLQRSGSSRGDGINALVAFPSLAANPVIGQLYTQLQTYQVQRDSLTTGRWAKAPGHPDVQRL